MKTKQELLNKLEEEIKHSGAGVELWFGSLDYNLVVGSGEMTFEEWFDQMIMGSKDL